MSRKPTPATEPTPEPIVAPHPLPQEGGCYVIENGELRPDADAAETTPSTEA